MNRQTDIAFLYILKNREAPLGNWNPIKKNDQNLNMYINKNN